MEVMEVAAERKDGVVKFAAQRVRRLVIAGLRGSQLASACRSSSAARSKSCGFIKYLSRVGSF
jgi:hypothetical protein